MYTRLVCRGRAEWHRSLFLWFYVRLYIHRAAWDRTEFKGNNEDMAMQLNKLSGDARGRKEKVLERVERKTEEIGYALHLPASMTVSIGREGNIHSETAQHVHTFTHLLLC